MKHFLTIERDLKHKGVHEERVYYFDKKKKSIQENIFNIPKANPEIPRIFQKTKTSSVKSFMLNLGALADHPGVIYKDDMFILWLAESYMHDRL